MPWLPNGDASCDTCALVRLCVADRHLAIQMMRAGGWRHMQGITLGGRTFETILCPGCTREEKKRKRTKDTVEQEELPLDFRTGGTVVGKQGFSSR